MSMTTLSTAVLLVTMMLLRHTHGQGPRGPPGDTGATGETGSIGLPGAKGARGPQGPIGIYGAPGVPGPGPRGSPGATGSPGDTGISGPRGFPGHTGAQGITGATGATGQRRASDNRTTRQRPCDGPLGPPGPPGVMGATGVIGIIGSTGEAGYTGFTGNQGPSGSQGKPGGYGPPGRAGSIGGRGVRGPPGPPGATGYRGATGATGATGFDYQTAKRRVARQAAGCPGPKGLPGATGATGATGFTGPTGSTGVTGYQGASGFTGATGPLGYGSQQGPPGSKGPRGLPSWQRGSTGHTGAPGLTGVQGATGLFRIALSAISVDIVRPLYGPESGGTRVTVIGQHLSVTTVTAVYIGQYELHPDTNRNGQNFVVVTTPPASDSELLQPLVISLVFYNESRLVATHKFIYRRNPTFTNIEPRNHLIVGGTEVTVTGSHFDSVAVPRIIVTVIVTRFDSNNSITESSVTSNSEPCTLPDTDPDGSRMSCRMPTVSLPHDLVEQLEHSDVATINNTEGPGVASYFYLASDGVSRTRADVYIGLELDGHTVYRNISSVDPDIKMQFAVQPVVLCQSDVLTFTSNYSTVINIQGRHLTRGSHLVDFDIRVGGAVCVPVSLNDTQVDCRLPTNKPNRNSNDTFCEDDTLSLRIKIGNSDYNCSCVRYVISEDDQVISDNLGLIVGLSTGFGLLIIIIIIVIIVMVMYRKRSNNSTASKQHHSPSPDIQINDNAEALELDQRDSNYSTVPESAELGHSGSSYCTIPDDVFLGNNDSEYCRTTPEKPDKADEYTALETPDYLTVIG